MYSSGHFPWEVYPRASWTPASTLHTWGFHLRSLKLDSSPGANRLWLGEKRQDWSGCFTARSTGFLGAEGLNVLNAGGRLKEHRGDHAHTHFVSLSLIDTHSLTHPASLITLAPQINMLNAGKKLNTEGTHKHTLPLSLLKWVLLSQHRSLCWMISVPVQPQYQKARLCGVFCLYCIPQSGNYEKYSFRWKRRQKYKTILILIGK